mmetsp:Transcript_8253/g.11779  ORF Transcript_8253/g.11779 Transcript_8253/m.11779 type:complete len:205 (-) Transcript_8253:171-785(-)
MPTPTVAVQEVGSLKSLRTPVRKVPGQGKVTLVATLKIDLLESTVCKHPRRDNEEEEGCSSLVLLVLLLVGSKSGDSPSVMLVIRVVVLSSISLSSSTLLLWLLSTSSLYCISMEHGSVGLLLLSLSVVVVAGILLLGLLGLPLLAAAVAPSSRPRTYLCKSSLYFITTTYPPYSLKRTRASQSSISPGLIIPTNNAKVTRPPA